MEDIFKKMGMIFNPREALEQLDTAHKAIIETQRLINNIGWHTLCDGYDYSDDGRIRHRKKSGEYKELVLTGGRFYADGRYWYFPKDGVPYQINKKQCK